MRRRLFLAGAGGVLTSLPLGAAAKPAGQSATDLPLLQSYITNREQFPDGQIAHADELLTLERRPQRKYHAASIAVMRSNGLQLGYLPLDSTAVLAALLDEGFGLYAKPSAQGAIGTGNVTVQIYWRRGPDGGGLDLNTGQKRLDQLSA